MGTCKLHIPWRYDPQRAERTCDCGAVVQTDIEHAAGIRPHWREACATVADLHADEAHPDDCIGCRTARGIAAAILYSRPVGNTDPDDDPAGTVLMRPARAQ
jgi:hypothetical protein